LFAKEQCRHCDEPGCIYVSEEGAGKKLDSGAVVYSDKMKGKALGTEAKEGCPFGNGFPQIDEKTGLIGKCTLCAERIEANMLPACVQSCPTGALMFGDKDEMIKKAKDTIAKMKAANKKAALYPGEEYSVMWILSYPPEAYNLV